MQKIIQKKVLSRRSETKNLIQFFNKIHHEKK